MLNHSTEDAPVRMVAVGTALTAVAVTIVMLRIYTRQIILHTTGPDDWMMVFSIVLVIGYVICIWTMYLDNMGYSDDDRWAVPSRMSRLIKTVLACEVLYYLAIFAVKVSILCFYFRIAIERTFELACKITIGVLCFFEIACIAIVCTQCVPLSSLWDVGGEENCINSTAFFYATSGIHVAIDIWILALPIKTLTAIRRRKRDQAAIIFVFGLGIFALVASIVRMYTIRIYSQSQYPFYDTVPINLWSLIEINVGIYCASIPTLRPLFSKAQRERSLRAAGRLPDPRSDNVLNRKSTDRQRSSHERQHSQQIEEMRVSYPMAALVRSFSHDAGTQADIFTNTCCVSNSQESNWSSSPPAYSDNYDSPGLRESGQSRHNSSVPASDAREMAELRHSDDLEELQSHSRASSSPHAEIPLQEMQAPFPVDD